MNKWFLYIIECRGGSLYTGITTDLEKRIREHNKGRASKYTRSHRPVILKYKETLGSESAARRREAAIKKLSRYNKLKMIRNNALVCCPSSRATL